MQNIPVLASRSEVTHSVCLQWPEGSWPTTMEAINAPQKPNILSSHIEMRVQYIIW